MPQQVPTIVGGLAAPSGATCTEETVGSIYMRGNPTDGAAVVYVCRLVNANNGTYAWDALVHNEEP